MTTSILNLDQSPEKLAELYGERDYYWYLNSPQFHRVFLGPLGRVLTRHDCRSCLDVGCGRGWLATYFLGHYTGVDGSSTAIGGARQQHPRRSFFVGRMEKPGDWGGPFDAIVFGGLFEVLVKPPQHVEFVELYSKFKPKIFVVYDLQVVDTTNLQQKFELLDREYATAEVPGLQEVKKHRKIEVYRWK